MYEAGRGIKQDLGNAVLWYQASAEQGFAGAQNVLAERYRLGHGVTQD